MRRKLIVLMTVASALSAQTPAKKTAVAQPPAMAEKPGPDKPALDKVKIEAYLRHLFVWPPPIEMTISDPKPGPMAGFYEVDVRGAQGNASQEETFYVSADGSKVVRGNVYDLAQNPFKQDLEKINTQYQPSIGTPGAPVVLVEFSDFECPYCREQAKTLRENLLAAYPKEVRLYYLDFPLESLHPWAKSAALAGRCIFHQNASTFWDYHDWIFQNQEQITPDNLRSKVLEFSKDKGIDAPQFNVCMDTRATEDEVNKTKAQGQALNLNSTPTLFVNGRRMVGATQWEDLKRVIDYEIDYQKTAKNAGENCGCNLQLPTAGAVKNAPVGLPGK